MAHSEDLRKRVVEAVFRDGMSRNAAASTLMSASPAPFVGLIVSEHGRNDAGSHGGDRRSARIEAHSAYLLGLIRRQPDITLLEIRERLIANCGERFSSSVIWRFFYRHENSHSKVVSAGRGPSR